jgi:hypothetical protein
VLTSVIGPGAADSAPSGTSGPASPAAQLIAVNASSLIGRPVAAAARRLREHGLAVRVRWQPSSRQPAGTVLSVRPGGRLPAGGLVVVTGALQPAGHRADRHGNRHGHGHGHGRGDGNGNGQGNGDG